MYTTVLAFAAALFLHACAPSHDAQDGRVAHVLSITDGDTIRVMTEEGVEHVRYVGIDAPELHHPTVPRQPFAEDARAANERLTGDGALVLHFGSERRDDYGRLLAYVFTRSGTFINAQLLDEGWARARPIPPNVDYAVWFAELESLAREHARGIWSQREAVTK